jgi:hypothetical protein
MHERGRCEARAEDAQDQGNEDTAWMLESQRERAQVEGRTRMRDGVEQRGTNEEK